MTDGTWFSPGDIVLPRGRPGRYIVLEWKPGWISVAPATRDNKRRQRSIGLSGSDRDWRKEVRAPRRLMRPCGVCGRRRMEDAMAELLVPVTFILNASTKERREFPAGTVFCYEEMRRLSTAVGQSRSEGQAIEVVAERFQREDGRVIFRGLWERRSEEGS